MNYFILNSLDEEESERIEEIKSLKRGLQEHGEPAQLVVLADFDQVKLNTYKDTIYLTDFLLKSSNLMHVAHCDPLDIVDYDDVVHADTKNTLLLRSQKTGDVYFYDEDRSYIRELDIYANGNLLRERRLYDKNGYFWRMDFFNLSGHMSLQIYYNLDGFPAGYARYDEGTQSRRVVILDYHGTTSEFDGWDGFNTSVLTEIDQFSDPNRFFVFHPSENLKKFDASFSQKVIPIYGNNDQIIVNDLKDIKLVIVSNLAQKAEIDPLGVETLLMPSIEKARVAQEPTTWQHRKPGKVSMLLDGIKTDQLESFISSLNLLRMKNPVISLDLYSAHAENDAFEKERKALIQLGLSDFVTIKQLPTDKTSFLSESLLFVVNDLSSMDDLTVIEALGQGTPIMVLQDSSNQLDPDNLGLLTLNNSLFESTNAIAEILSNRDFWTKQSLAANKLAEPMEQGTQQALWGQILLEVDKGL